MAALSLVAGIICVSTSIFILIANINKSNSVKEKWGAFVDFIIDYFTGLTALFYLGLLLILFSLLKLLNLL